MAISRAEEASNYLAAEFHGRVSWKKKFDAFLSLTMLVPSFGTNPNFTNATSQKRYKWVRTNNRVSNEITRGIHALTTIRSLFYCEITYFTFIAIIYVASVLGSVYTCMSLNILCVR